MLIDRRPNIETNGNNPPRVSLRSSAQADDQTRGGFFIGVRVLYVDYQASWQLFHFWQEVQWLL